MLHAAILVVSDRSSQGLREDATAPMLTDLLATCDIKTVDLRIVPDEIPDIRDALVQWCDKGIDLVVTTGGTGVSPRDVTPEATQGILDKEIPGMAEAMRAAGTAITPHAMLSRAVTGIRKSTLIINLPGSPKGAVENLTTVLPAVKHAVEKIKGSTVDCGSL